jgi:hypothetical protein
VTALITIIMHVRCAQYVRFLKNTVSGSKITKIAKIEIKDKKQKHAFALTHEIFI